MSTKLEKFREDAKKAAKDFEKKQEAQSQGTDPTLSDITANFNKNRNEVVIGERKFVIKKFGILDTIMIIPKLGNTLVVPISAIAGSGEEDGGVTNGVTDSLFLLFQGMENGEFLKTVEHLLASTTIDGREVAIDGDFDDISELFQLCVRSLEINFSTFLKSLDLGVMTGWLQNIQQLR